MHWFYEPDFKSGKSLSSETKKHLVALRIEATEPIVVTDGNGSTWEAFVAGGEISSIGAEKRALESGPGFTLVQALAKSDRDELALQASVELGANRIVPWQAQRSIVRWDQKAEKNRLRWQAIAIESMKQSQRSFAPLVSDLVTTKQIEADGLGVILDPRAEVSISELPAADRYTIVVGPEGGIAEEELGALKSKGFLGVRLGRGVLRASNAGPAAIAALQLLHGEFRS
ncbi:MAG: hypothetical protein RIS08_576 [Actinomycetota bacterium]|jgi:16S rRNA (uracil1498-N3)-methyltransferase